MDDNGDIFVSDTGNNLIRQVMPDGTIHTIAGQAQAGFSGDGGLALSAQLDAPAGIVIDGAGALYFADTGNSRVRRISPQAAAQPITSPVTPLPQLSAVNAASLLGGAVAPGEIVTIYGSGIGPPQGIAGTLNASGLLSNLLGGSEVRFDGVAAPIFYAQAGQVNAQAPYTIAGQTTTHLEVLYQGFSVGQADLPVSAAAPAVFPTVLNPDGSLNGAANPTSQGAILTFFATGEGITTGANVTGQPASRALRPTSVAGGADYRRGRIGAALCGRSARPGGHVAGGCDRSGGDRTGVPRMPSSASGRILGRQSRCGCSKRRTLNGAANPTLQDASLTLQTVRESPLAPSLSPVDAVAYCFGFIEIDPISRVSWVTLLICKSYPFGVLV